MAAGYALHYLQCNINTYIHTYDRSCLLPWIGQGNAVGSRQPRVVIKMKLYTYTYTHIHTYIDTYIYMTMT